MNFYANTMSKLFNIRQIWTFLMIFIAWCDFVRKGAVRCEKVRCEMVRKIAIFLVRVRCGLPIWLRTQGAGCGFSGRTAPHPISGVKTIRIQCITPEARPAAEGHIRVRDKLGRFANQRDGLLSV